MMMNWSWFVQESEKYKRTEKKRDIFSHACDCHLHIHITFSDQTCLEFFCSTDGDIIRSSSAELLEKFVTWTSRL